jgi:hypothetical protein
METASLQQGPYSRIAISGDLHRMPLPSCFSIKIGSRAKARSVLPRANHQPILLAALAKPNPNRCKIRWPANRMIALFAWLPTLPGVIGV